MTTPTPVFEFPINDADESEGLGDAGIETFRDAPYASCAREAGQNSRDARREGADKPVRVTFDVLQVKPSDFPGHGRLTSALRSCLEHARDEKEKDFFGNALQVCGKSAIPVLRIADYNTTGLVGPPDEANTPFNSLLKSKGVSKKDSDTSGGSFGIGKNASMAVSELQTVFYSTSYIKSDDGEKAFAAQGKVILVSHEGEDGKPRRATGYWGNPEKFRAVTEDSHLPDWLKRSDVGTSIFCMGFRESEYWAEWMVCSLVSNFFVAIHRGQMEFEVEARPINRNTLDKLLGSGEISQAVETTAHKADLEFAKDLYRCLTSGLAREELVTIAGLGEMRIRILIEKGMPSRVGFVRNGMLITDNLAHFGHPLARFPGARDFICLVEPADDEAGKLLKQLENPAHNSFSAERLSEPSKRDSAKKAMSALGKKLRAMIKEQAGIQYEASSLIDELAHLFGEGGGFASAGVGVEPDPERYTYRVVRQEPRRQNPPAGFDGKGGGNTGGNQKKKTNSSGGGSGGGAGTKGDGDKGTQGQRQAIALAGVRNRGADESGNKRSLFFTVDVSCAIELSVQATGINAPELLIVTGTSAGELEKGRIVLPVKGGERQHLDIAFDEPYDGPIEISAVKIGDLEVSK